MNFPTIIVLLLVAAAAGLAVRSILRQKKSAGCGGTGACGFFCGESCGKLCDGCGVIAMTEEKDTEDPADRSKPAAGR